MALTWPAFCEFCCHWLHSRASRRWQRPERSLAHHTWRFTTPSGASRLQFYL